MLLDQYIKQLTTAQQGTQVIQMCELTCGKLFCSVDLKLQNKKELILEKIMLCVLKLMERKRLTTRICYAF